MDGHPHPLRQAVAAGHGSLGPWRQGISPSDIKGFSISIADKDETPFSLEIASIRAIDLKA